MKPKIKHVVVSRELGIAEVQFQVLCDHIINTIIKYNVLRNQRLELELHWETFVVFT